jgi:hypothetical protein
MDIDKQPRPSIVILVIEFQALMSLTTKTKVLDLQALRNRSWSVTSPKSLQELGIDAAKPMATENLYLYGSRSRYEKSRVLHLSLTAVVSLLGCSFLCVGPLLLHP